MLTLLIPKSMGGSSIVPIEFEPDSEIDDIELKLRVWHEDETTKFIYSPSGSAIFFTDKNTQTLTITLKSQTYIDLSGNKNPRFVIIGHTTKKKKLIKGVMHKERASGLFIKASEPHKFPIDFHTDAVKYELALEKDIDDTYINIIVQDMTDGSIIDCDPQAENGTRT